MGEEKSGVIDLDFRKEFNTFGMILAVCDSTEINPFITDKVSMILRVIFPLKCLGALAPYRRGQAELPVSRDPCNKWPFWKEFVVTVGSKSYFAGCLYLIYCKHC